MPEPGQAKSLAGGYMNTQEALNKYTDNLFGIATLSAEKQEVIDGVLTPEIKAKLAEIEEEFASKSKALTEENEFLKAQITAAVIAQGETISGEFHQAVYSKPRVTWDNKGLAGYSVAHPEIQVFQRIGEPSVSIRARGGNA